MPAAAATAPNLGLWINAANTFYAYTEAGESLDVNFTPIKTSLIDAGYEGPSNWDTVRQEMFATITAPDGTSNNCAIANGAVVDNSTTTCDFTALTSADAGIWKIDFTRGDIGTNPANSNPWTGTGAVTFAKWEITAHSGATVKPGRVWSDEYKMTQYGRAAGSDGKPSGVDTSVWFLGENGYLYQADYQNFNGIDSTLLSDAFGVTTTEDGCTVAYASSGGNKTSAGEIRVDTDTSSPYAGQTSADYLKALSLLPESNGFQGLSNGRCGTPYHLFFESPDTTMPESASLAGGSTVFLNPAIQTPKIESFTWAPNAEGSFAGTFSGAMSGVGAMPVDVQIDVDGDGASDVTVTGALAADGTFNAGWDGKDAAGDPLAVTGRIAATLQVTRMGEIHFIRDDVERSGGLRVQRLNGTNTGYVALQWDDEKLLAGGLSGQEEGAHRSCSTAALTGPGAADGSYVHGWATGHCGDGYQVSGNFTDGGVVYNNNSNSGIRGGWGDVRRIDDWTYETYDGRPYSIELGPLPTVELIKAVDGRVDADDQFRLAISTATNTELATATTQDGGTGATTGATGVLPERTYTLSEVMADGSTNPLTGYTGTLACVAGNESVTATAGDAGTWTVATPASAVYRIVDDGDPATTTDPQPQIAPVTITCTVTNVAKDGPTAGPDTVTVGQGETATLTPTVTPGDGAITGAAFDNGDTTKTVAGQGTWTIAVDPTTHAVTATFVPEAGFTGPVTQQPYTVTDENGLKASSTLDVVITPKTGDASATINPNETATLNPETTPGGAPLSGVTFDNGETTKVVAGEGTWTIALVEGEVVATFAPEADYYGTVTSQGYTVTDQNGESASGSLSVEINDPPVAGDASVTIAPNAVANLAPEVTPGTGAITEAVFDNGDTTKVVAGEGTWTISVDGEGKVTATFASADPTYSGAVTPQEYTVTDANGLKDSGTLSVTITEPAAAQPPVAGDDSATINPGETANLDPVVTAGSGVIESALFDNGQTTKVVVGEGTWTLALDGEGKVTATFASADPTYSGAVTPQEYTVTDANGLKDSGTLSVTITEPAAAQPPVAGDASKVINPNQTATLNPETTPGGAPLSGVTFDNGETTKVVAGEGTWTIALVEGEVVATFAPEADFYGTVTPQEYTVTDQNGESASGSLSVEINDPPAAGNDTVTIAPGETANLDPVVTAGSGVIESALFDNGQTTKVVVGEGTWTLALDGEGKVTATFASADPTYSGAVTPQEYTVTDANGLKDSGTLSVTITQDPTQPTPTPTPPVPTPAPPVPTPTPTPPAPPTPKPTHPGPTDPGPTHPGPTHPGHHPEPTDPGPTHPEPTKPEPTKPGQTKPGSTTTTTQRPTTTTTSKGSALPNTGAEGVLPLAAAAGAALIGGLFLLKVRGKRRDDEDAVD